MSKSVPLTAAARTKDENLVNMRRSGNVPGIVYGNVENTMLQFEEMPLKKAHAKAGESTVVELDVNGKKIPALFHKIDYDPVSDRMIHVDFYAVNMKEEVEAEVQIRFENESPAVKDGAIFVTALHEVLVTALPADLPHDLPLDLSKLVEMGSHLTVADLHAPKGVTILTPAETVIVIAQEPRAEVVEEAPAPSDAAAAPADGAAPAEGDAAATEEKKD